MTTWTGASLELPNPVIPDHQASRQTVGAPLLMAAYSHESVGRSPTFTRAKRMAFFSRVVAHAGRPLIPTSSQRLCISIRCQMSARKLYAPICYRCCKALDEIDESPRQRKRGDVLLTKLYYTRLGALNTLVNPTVS